MCFHNKIVAGVAFIATLAATLTTIQAAPLYKVTALGLGIAYDINNAGQVVGETFTNGVPRAAVWSDGSAIELGTLGGTYSTARSINNSGQVVGFSADSNGQVHTVIWNNGTITNAIPASSDIYFTSISNSGSLAGSVNGQAAIWKNGIVTTFEGTGVASAINDLDQVVGVNGDTAALWNKGIETSLGTLGGDYSNARAINNSGQIVGESRTPGGTYALHPVLWSNGITIDLGTLGFTDFFGNAYDYATDINNKGQVVGTSAGFGYEAGRAGFYWEKGTLYNINDLLDELSAGWIVYNIAGINDNSQIVANAYNPILGYQGAVRLDLINAPTNDVPEPATVALMGVALMGAPLLRRKRRTETVQKA